MRSKKSLFIPGVVVALASFVAVGCSGDDETITKPGPQTITDSQYAAVQAQVNEFVDSTLALYATGFAQTATTTGTEIESGFFGPNPADSTTSSGSWTTLFNTDFGASATNLWIDSVQYRDVSGQPMAIGAGASSLTVRHLWTKRNTDTTVSFSNYDVQANLNFNGLRGTVADVSGIYTMDVRSKFVSIDSTVNRDYVIRANVTNLKFNKAGSNWVSNCPTSGVISVTVDLDYKNDAAATLSSSSTWTFSVNFTNGTADVGVVRGTESAAYVQQFCTP